MEQSGDVPRETSGKPPRPCAVCGAIHFEPALRLKDYSVSKEPFEIIQCKGCGFKFTHPVPVNLNPYYDSEDYISHSKTKKGFINRLYHLAQQYNLASKFKKAKKHAQGKKWIDYGSGAGDFLQMLRKKKMHVSGVEPHEPVRIKCEKEGFSVLTPEAYLATKTPCDIITMWHVLEHVDNLDEVLQKHRSNLSSAGILVIAVPNPDSLDARIYKEHWAAYDVPRHLWHFTENDIRALAENSGFEFIERHGMILDAFYISMLSEKYKHGNLIAAVINGLRSNLSALLGRTPYSSQIYIFRKTASEAV